MSPRTDAARNFLELVRHLHLRGHQLLRIVPFVREGPAPFWACNLVHAAETSETHGALTRDFVEDQGFFCVRYVPNSPWSGFAQQSLDEAADTFAQACPQLAQQTLGQDEAYVRWYEEMLTVTAPKGLVASKFYWEDPPNRMYVLNVKSKDPVDVPLPPTKKR